MSAEIGTNQVSLDIIAAMQKILEGEGEIKKAEAETVLLLSQALQIVSVMPAQFAKTEGTQASIRAIPANSVQPA